MAARKRSIPNLREQLEAHGWSSESLAQEIGCSPTTVRTHARKAGIDIAAEAHKRRPPPAVRKAERTLLQELQADKAIASLYEAVSTADMRLPRWTAKLPSKKGKRRHVAAVAFLSDTHFDEVVHASQMFNVNMYNRAIAELRLKRFFTQTIKLSYHWAVNRELIEIDYLVLPLGGDILSGNIHEELRQTNESTILGSVLHWSAHIAAGIEQLLEHFPRIFVPCVVGNHGRLDRKPRAKFRAHENYDWLVYKLLERHFIGEPRVEFAVPDGADIVFSVYDYRILLTHGDQFRGGSGIAGVLSPIMLGDHRKRKRQQAIDLPYDLMICGHWHQLLHAKGVLINGSLKGYDEYALVSNFDFEPPQQAFFLVAPEHGITLEAPVRVMNREEEGW